MLLFCDSFDHYATADAPVKGWALSGTSISASTGRNSTASLRSANDNFAADWTLPSAIASVVIGFSWYRYSNSNAVIILRDAVSGVDHLQFKKNAGGFIEVRRGVNGTVLATGTHQLLNTVAYYIEIKATIHDSTGAVDVHVNEVSDISISGQDTRNGGLASVDQLRFGFAADNSVGGVDYDDMYVCDTTGSVNNDFLGDVRVEALFPNGNGNTSNLVGSDGNSTDNYLLVDETAPNTTDYVESSTVSDKDTYAYTNLTPTSGTVKGVQILSYARKTDAGTRSIATIARHSGTEVDSSNFTLSTSYAYFRDIRETKPGGGAWSISDVNGAEFGVKVTA